jgi:hypothetical protein
MLRPAASSITAIRGMTPCSVADIYQVSVELTGSMLREGQSKEVILPQAVSTKVPPKILNFLLDYTASNNNRQTES